MTTEKKRKEKKINDFKKKGALKQKANSEQQQDIIGDIQRCTRPGKP